MKNYYFKERPRKKKKGNFVMLMLSKKTYKTKNYAEEESMVVS